MMRNTKYEYDVALSFAGENRVYVEEVAQILKKNGIRVFYDLFEEANLWGNNLYVYLSDVYQNKAKYTVLFISKFYNKKLWTNHERASMQARAFQESHEYILPARFDNTEIPGILKTVGYINLQQKTAVEFALLIQKKVKKESRYGSHATIRTANEGTVKPFIFAIKVINKKNIGIKQAKVVLVAKNSTYLEGLSDENGFAYFVIKTRKLYTILVAHSSYLSELHEGINPKNDIEVIMKKESASGSVILNKSGRISGISGQIEPYIKKNNQMVISADNIAIEGGVNQPFEFELNQPISAEDSQGKLLHLVFKFLQGSISLIDFYKHKMNPS